MREITVKPDEFVEFTLKRNGEEYSLPCSYSLPFAKVLEIQEAWESGNLAGSRCILGFLREHMGDIADDLRQDEVEDIISYWADTSTNNSGATTGE